MRLILDIGSRYAEINGPASDAFANDLRQAIHKDEYSELVLDMKGTRMISSMAMGTIFAASQKLRDQGKSLHIVNASDRVVNLLRMVNMSELLQPQG